MKRLIVNADDFGLTAGINRAVMELGTEGVLTSTTLMANAPATAAAASLHPSGLGIGCHVVLVDGEPVLTPDSIPSLVDSGSDSGRSSTPPRFRPTLRAFVIDLLRGRIREADIEAEAIAQIRRLQQLDVAVTHIDTHKHTHMFPRVLRPLLRAAVLCNVVCIRNPFEPDWSIAATFNAGLLRRLEVKVLNTQRDYFLKAIGQIGMTTTDGALGVLATGTLDERLLRDLLRSMPDGCWELVCHPGYSDPDLAAIGTRLLKSREIERAALLEVISDALAVDSALSLVDFDRLKSARFMAVL